MADYKKRTIDKRPLYRDEIKSALMDAITSGELQPGDRIVETRWAKELGVSQSPIREAIRELELIGMVESIPYKGCVVRKITKKEIVDTYRVRVALESMAIEETIRKGDPEVAEQMKNALKEMLEGAEEGDINKFVNNDVLFHEAFINGADNEVVKRLWQQCYIHDNTTVTAALSEDSMPELAKRHRMILDAVQKGDAHLGRQEIDMHFQLLIDGLKDD